MDQEAANKLKPNGVLKVVSIPFGSRDNHYAFSIQPGNSVWGSSWAKQGRSSNFEEAFRQNMKTQDQTRPTISPTKRRRNRKEDNASVRDRMTSNMSHVILAVAILAAALWLFKPSP